MTLYALYGKISFFNHIEKYKSQGLITADLIKKLLYDLICLIW